MTNEELLSVAEIVERATKRFNEQAALHKVRCDQYDQLIADMKAEHETKMVEHRAAFGARTVADTKIIAGLREELNQVRNSLGIQAAKEAGKALGMVEGEGLRAAAQRVVKERDALRTECDDLRRVFSLVHGSLGIQQGEHIGNAIDALKKERDELATRLRQSIARGDFAEMRLATLAAELETERERHRQTAAVPQSVDVPRTHPVKVGEWVRRLVPSPACGVGTVAKVVHVNDNTSKIEYDVKRIDGQHGFWFAKNCEPCDPPNHDTEAGKAAAEAAVKNELDELKVGDVVRATSWKAGKAALVKKILSDGRLMLDCSDQPWRVDEVVKLARKVTT